MDDDFGEDENKFVSQKVEKIVLQVNTAVVVENNSFKAPFVYMNEEKELKVLKEERYKQKFLGDYCFIETDSCFIESFNLNSCCFKFWMNKDKLFCIWTDRKWKSIYYENSLVRNRGSHHYSAIFIVLINFIISHYF